MIKSHHNVGGLPDFVDFKEIIEPLRDLFKDEVRKAGLELGIPEDLVFRQPFPGPGLGIRIIGEVTAEKVRIVQDADAIYREEIAKAGLDKEINQYFAALTNMRSVGVMGDERTYDYAVALRAVNTVDFMTAEEYRALLNTDFSDADIEQLTDIRNIKIDKNLSQEKRQAQFLKQVGNPYLLRRGSMMIKVSFANNGLSMEQAFENLLLNV